MTYRIRLSKLSDFSSWTPSATLSCAKWNFLYRLYLWAWQ